MQLLSGFIEKCPNALQSQFQNMYNVVTKFSPINQKQQLNWLKLLAELFHLASQIEGINIAEVHECIFEQFITQMTS